MITMPCTGFDFIVETMNHKPGEYLIKGGGFTFHAVVNAQYNTSWLQVLPTKRYSPPPRCVEYLYYDADCRLGLDAIDEFFEELNCKNLADSLRAKFLELTL